MQKHSKIAAAVALAAIIPTLALAQGNGSIHANMEAGLKMGLNKIIKSNSKVGTVVSVSGNTVTITGKDNVTYTVDATNAKLYRRFGATMLLANVQNGDTIQVFGSVNGTNIAATLIRDESLQTHNGSFEGTVSAISGSSFTLQSKKRGNQTIHTDSATMFKLGNATGTIASLSVGEQVVVKGVWDRTNSNVTAKVVSVPMKSFSFKGILESIVGSTLTVNSTSTNASSTVFTVDDSHARVTYKNGHKADSTILQVNDQVQVVGKGLQGYTNVSATIVR